jgi:DNA polymerase-4
LIIGGGKRGVVATACYIARTYGVRSAMPMFKALALCPQAVVIRPDIHKYVAVGRTIRQMMVSLTPLVEPLSIDEAFLDLSGTQRLHGHSPAATLARFAKRVETEIGVSVSIGLSYCKFLAKVASDLDKPRGFALIGQAEAVAFLKTKPVSLIWGVGKSMQDHLARDNITRIGDLQNLSQELLLSRYGVEGQRFYRLARGVDDRSVSPERNAKSISSETTFNADIADFETLARTLFKLSEKLSKRLKIQGLAGRGITLKLKSADFVLKTRAKSLPEPTQLAGRIFEAGRSLLVKEALGTRYRLIGIGMSHLCDGAEADRGDLADHGVVRERAAETAIDRLRDKFGDSAIVRGIVFDGKKRR